MEPKLLTEAELQSIRAMAFNGYDGDRIETLLRERGLIAPEPDAFDRLRDALDDLHGIYLDRDKMVDVCRRAGIELAPRVELTREMVREALARAMFNTPSVGICILGDRFVELSDNLHAAIVEQLKEAGRG